MRRTRVAHVDPQPGDLLGYLGNPENSTYFWMFLEDGWTFRFLWKDDVLDEILDYQGGSHDYPQHTLLYRRGDAS